MQFKDDRLQIPGSEALTPGARFVVVSAGDGIELVAHCLHAAGTRLVRHNDEWLLQHSWLSSNVSDVVTEAQEICRILESLALLHGLRCDAFDATGVVREVDHGGSVCQSIVMGPAIVEISAGPMLFSLNGELQVPGDGFIEREFVQLASIAGVRMALLALAGSPDAYDLWKAFELLREAFSVDKIVSAGWATQGQINSLRRTLNDPGVLGALARHALPQNHPPDAIPLTMREARLTVREMWKNAIGAALEDPGVLDVLRAKLGHLGLH